MDIYRLLDIMVGGALCYVAQLRHPMAYRAYRRNRLQCTSCRSNNTYHTYTRLLPARQQKLFLLVGLVCRDQRDMDSSG